MASPVGGSLAVRELVAVRVPLPALVGSLAGKANLHRFEELTAGLGASQCAHCFGWRDDTRHVVPKAATHG